MRSGSVTFNPEITNLAMGFLVKVLCWTEEALRRLSGFGLQGAWEVGLMVGLGIHLRWQEDRAVAAGVSLARVSGGGKSELRRAVCRITSGM